MGNQKEIKPRDVYNSYAKLLRTFGFRAHVGPATEGDPSGYRTNLLHRTQSRDIVIGSKPRGLAWEELSEVLPPLKSALGPITVQKFSKEGREISAFVLRRGIVVRKSNGEAVDDQTLLHLDGLAKQIAIDRGAKKPQPRTR